MPCVCARVPTNSSSTTTSKLRNQEPKVAMQPLVLSLIGIGILSVSGYLGGQLVYDNGIAVGRHRRRTATPGETLRFSTADIHPDEHNGKIAFVPIVGEDRLQNAETLRIEIDGQIMVLVRLNGNFYAFQEFCTHRFGPLSEGAFKDNQVQCPWHRSCFDLRTGKVTEGPAKADLKIFKVEVRDGKICVGIPRKQEEKLHAGTQRNL